MLLALLAPAGVRGQGVEALRSGASATIASANEARVSAALVPQMRRAIDSLPLWTAPVASLLVPGLGQAQLHKDRFIAFMSVEAFLIVQLMKNNKEWRTSATSYRALARDVARQAFAGARADTIFEYYEAMGKYVESGAFSSTPNGPVIPETDTLTYNGKQWLLARKQYGVPLDDPSAALTPNYAQALSFYQERAVSQYYGWSWRDAQLEQDVFKREIMRSNEAYARAQRNLTALIANHLLSAIDAFAIVRIIQATNGDTRISATVPLR
jgi:hypothetical protein